MKNYKIILLIISIAFVLNCSAQTKIDSLNFIYKRTIFKIKELMKIFLMIVVLEFMNIIKDFQTTVVKAE